MSDLDYSYLSERLRYDPHTGELWWVRQNVGKGQRKRLDRPAGYINRSGYVMVIIDNTHYRAHRIAWTLRHRKPPVNDIDHINRDRSDNRLCNLREATRSQNMANRVGVESKSGFKGVYFDNDRGKYQSSIKIGSKKIHLGRYTTAEEAARAYDAKAITLFGEYALVNFQ